MLICREMSGVNIGHFRTARWLPKQDCLLWPALRCFRNRYSECFKFSRNYGMLPVFVHAESAPWLHDVFFTESESFATAYSGRYSEVSCVRVEVRVVVIVIFTLVFQINI